MKFIKYAILVALSSTAFGGNDSGVGGGKGKTIEEQAVIEIPAGKIDDLLSKIPADSLIKDLDGKTTLIPLSAENIRRLDVRASVDGKTSLTLDSGEKFLLQKDMDKRLVDPMKSAIVIEKIKQAD